MIISYSQISKILKIFFVKQINDFNFFLVNEVTHEAQCDCSARHFSPIYR